MQNAIFLYLKRTPNIHCVRSAGRFEKNGGEEFVFCHVFLDSIIELQQRLQSFNDDESPEHLRRRNVSSAAE